MAPRSTTRIVTQDSTATRARIDAERLAQRHQLRRAVQLAEQAEQRARELHARLRVGGSLLDNVAAVQAVDAAREVTRALHAALASLEPAK